MGWGIHNQVATQEVFVKFYPEHSKPLWHSVVSDRILKIFPPVPESFSLKAVEELNFSENVLLDLLWSSSSSGFTDSYFKNPDLK